MQKYSAFLKFRIKCLLVLDVQFYENELLDSLARKFTADLFKGISKNNEKFTKDKEHSHNRAESIKLEKIENTQLINKTAESIRHVSDSSNSMVYMTRD